VNVLEFLDAFLSPLRLWLRARGGHWEYWYVDHPVLSDVWHRVDRCSTVTGNRPTSLCRGTPICETYRL
jgi:hypothetical protein